MAEAYTLALILSVIALGGFFLFLSKIFNKDQRAIKTFMVMMTLGVCIIISQMIKVIASENGGASAASLELMGTMVFIISITLFMFFLMYYFITYTRDLFVSIRKSKEEKRYGNGWM